ncbi:MAG: Z1 domain-containing protein [Candidatus Methanomethylophilus sp.]|nr:Z1 domain-containing protein [Methanomethylophilus sp.]
MLFDEYRYKMPREWIFNKRKNGGSWECILHRDDSFFKNHIQDDDYPESIKEDWPALVQSIKECEENKERIKEIIKRGTIVSRPERNILEPKTDDDSCWVCYKKKLKNEKYFSDESLNLIEEECASILRKLSVTTSVDDPVRGLVVGNVQSGKTANMAGLIAMAADCGWNFFIVLSGTIEKLREQTRDRLYNDLSNDDCRLYFQKIDRLELGASDCKISQMRLNSGTEYGTDTGARCLTVCLKQKTRLTKVLDWLNQDEQKKKQLRILLIDDEADQAGVNTAEIEENEDETPHIEERKTINDLIVKIVNGSSRTENKTTPYGAMNYIGYTATPYANFLSDNTPEGLFPKDFITVLTTPCIYLGPKQTFGYESQGYEGLSIFKQMDDDDPALISLECGDTDKLPDEMKNSVCWFLYCVCALRKLCTKQPYLKQPISMLIHTDLHTEVHNRIAKAIGEYFETEKDDILNRTESVFNDKSKEMSLADFHKEVPAYHAEGVTINDYVPFSEIKDELKTLIEIKLKHIQLDKSGNKVVWSHGVNLCIDNSTKQTVLDTANAVPRLLYPTDEDLRKMPSPPAFIVIGGNTLSRGLTLKGLVSTYFTRSSTQADSMMQMGRWFGYRRGYELYPRIWITRKIFLDFITAIDVDEELRCFMLENYTVLRPETVPPVVRKFPRSAYVKNVTSKAKSRAAKVVDPDFRGTLVESSVFDNKKAVLESNTRTVRAFLTSLKNPEPITIQTGCYVWRGISSDALTDGLLDPFIFSSRIDLSDEKYIRSMMKWISKYARTDKWNVVLAGPKRISPDTGEFCLNDNISVGKVERRNKTDGSDGQIHLGFVSNASDRIADVFGCNLSSKTKSEIDSELKDISKNWRSIRRLAGLNSIPVIIIYCISKNSRTRKGRDLNAEADIMALSIVLPGYESDQQKKEGKREYISINPINPSESD